MRQSVTFVKQMSSIITDGENNEEDVLLNPWLLRLTQKTAVADFGKKILNHLLLYRGKPHIHLRIVCVVVGDIMR